jgi:hypothetical protein
MPAPIWPARFCSFFLHSLARSQSELELVRQGNRNQKCTLFLLSLFGVREMGRLCLSYLVLAIWIFLCLPNDMMSFSFGDDNG